MSRFFLNFLFPLEIIIDKRAAKRRAKAGYRCLCAPLRRSLVVFSSAAAPPPFSFHFFSFFLPSFLFFSFHAPPHPNVSLAIGNRRLENYEMHNFLFKKRCFSIFFLRSFSINRLGRKGPGMRGKDAEFNSASIGATTSSRQGLELFVRSKTV